MYDTLLIPTDGSPCATRAVEYGLDLAERFDTTVELLYVVDNDRGAEGGWDIVVERLEDEGERALDDAHRRAVEHDVVANRHLRRGSVSSVICESATEYGVDLIVMGICGRSALSRLFRPGSTTERVIRQSSIPVTVVPPADEAGAVDE